MALVDRFLRSKMIKVAFKPFISAEEGGKKKLKEVQTAIITLEDIYDIYS